MKFYSVKEFTNKYKVSSTTMYRFYRSNPELKEQTKKKNGRRWIPEKHYRFFDIETLRNEIDALIIDNKKLKTDNESMKNLIYGLSNPDSFGYKLWHMPWTYFLTVSYIEPKSQKYCYNKMTKLYEKVEKDIGSNSNVRMFFTTEKHTTNEGYHSHAVFYIENELFRTKTKKSIEKFFRPHRLDVQPYTKLKGAVFYMMKEGLSGEDWDFFYNSPVQMQKGQ